MARKQRPWWGGLAVGGYVVAVGLPLFTAMLFVWVASGADVVAEPVTAQGPGVVRTCEPGGALYLREWYSCSVHLTGASRMPHDVRVEAPDLGPTDIGHTVEVQQRSFRNSAAEYTVDRDRPWAIPGFAVSAALVLLGWWGLNAVLRRAGWSE